MDSRRNVQVAHCAGGGWGKRAVLLHSFEMDFCGLADRPLRLVDCYARSDTYRHEPDPVIPMLPLARIRWSVPRRFRRAQRIQGTGIGGALDQFHPDHRTPATW